MFYYYIGFTLIRDTVQGGFFGVFFGFILVRDTVQGGFFGVFWFYLGYRHSPRWFLWGFLVLSWLETQSKVVSFGVFWFYLG